MEQFLDPNDPTIPLLTKRVRLGTLLFILAAILVTHFIYLPWSDNEARLDKVRTGMAREEVETILRGPPDGLRHGGSEFYWTFHDGTANVRFDSDGKVTGKRDWYRNHGSSPMEFIRRLLRKIGL